MPPEGYDVRHDPDAVNKIACLLLEGWRDRPGEPVHLGKCLGTADMWSVRTYVDCLRRLGWVIEGRRGHAGYTFVCWSRSPRWTHLDNVLRDVVRKSEREG